MRFVGAVERSKQVADELRPLAANGFGKSLRLAFDAARRGVRVADQQARQEAADRQALLVEHRRQ